jgi:hypothetical protein
MKSLSRTEYETLRRLNPSLPPLDDDIQNEKPPKQARVKPVPQRRSTFKPSAKKFVCQSPIRNFTPPPSPPGKKYGFIHRHVAASLGYRADEFSLGWYLFYLFWFLLIGGSPVWLVIWILIAASCQELK